jgi:hypothetical protein
METKLTVGISQRTRIDLVAGFRVELLYECRELYGERAFYPVVFKRINDFQKKIHHQIYHQDVVAYQFRTLPDSARKIVF